MSSEPDLAVISSEPSVAVIGSFKTKERYAEVVKTIETFRSEGWRVTSPAGSAVLEADIDFVRFESDDPRLSDAEVQSETLSRIMQAKLTYVCAVGGYIGRTTCYEVGRLIQAPRPLFFSAAPLDLPVEVPSKFIASAREVARLYRQGPVPTLFRESAGYSASLERQLINE